MKLLLFIVFVFGFGSGLKADQNLGINIKAVIFDCDGTLVDSESTHYLGWQHALQKQGSDLTPDEYCFFVGKSAQTIAVLLAQRIGTDCSVELLRDKQAFCRTLQDAGLPPIEATVDFVRRLADEKSKSGLKLGVASAGKKEGILMHLRHLEIDRLFDAVISGVDDLDDYFDPEGTNKPKPYIYLHIAKALGVSPSECIVIEDSRSGVSAGVDAGCFTVAVPNLFTRQQDLSRAHVKIESFENVDAVLFLQMPGNISAK